MEIRREQQLNPVADEVSAITAVVRPILQGILFSLKHQVVEEAGGRNDLKLFMLARLRRAGDGDVGICFEYAVHDALNRCEPAMVERVADALTRCAVNGDGLSSILFGAEKTGSQQLIETAADLLTEESSLMSGSRGRPVKLKRHLTGVSAAFRSQTKRALLPQSIGGLWKADLFLGMSTTDKWVGTTVKVNPTALEGAPGLRIGIVPTRQGRSDAISVDTSRNLVVCPVPYDASFMEVFYLAWEVVSQFLAADARVPAEVNLPRPAQREVARYLADRREFGVQAVIDALAPMAQPELLATHEENATLVLTDRNSAEVETSAILAPSPASV